MAQQHKRTGATLMETMWGQIAFSSPWALSALFALPLIYWLLRVTPPPPRHIVFPATRFLKGLIPRSQTPSQTPWWILLIRLLAAACLLLALAGPVLNPSSAIPGDGPLRLVIDNGWGAARNWSTIQREAESIIQNTGNSGREIYIQTTTPEKEDQKVSLFGPWGASDALAFVRAIKPLPWPRDMEKLDLKNISGTTIFLTDGVWTSSEKSLFLKHADTFAREGDFILLKPARTALPLALRLPENDTPKPAIELMAPSPLHTLAAPVHVQILSERGDIMDDVEAKTRGKVEFNVPPSLQNKISAIRIAGHPGAQSLFMQPVGGGTKTVGLFSSVDNTQARALSEDSFFIRKALEPYANLVNGSITALLEQKPGMIILPDVASMPASSLNALDAWVKTGGLLLRFAGPNMTQTSGTLPLTPIPLQPTARALEGALSGATPAELAPISTDNILYGLALPEDFTLARQILPAPAEDMNEKTWLKLSDGTPLITAAPYGEGLLVMVHTTASPAWSNLALSGFFVNFLKKMTDLAGHTEQIKRLEGGMLQPLKILDGFGHWQNPGPDVKPIDISQFDITHPSPSHPPGLYGQGTQQRALNLGEAIGDYQILEAPSLAARSKLYAETPEQSLMPYLIAMAFLMLLADFMISIIISSAWFFRFAACLMLFMPISAQAQDSATYADGLYLAYITTGDAAVDSQTAQGLDILSKILVARSSTEMRGIVPINPETDTLAYFPLLYWAVTDRQSDPSQKAFENLQDYLDHGGTIYIDTRDGGSGRNADNLKRLLSGLNIHPLIQLPKDHVLTKSFYLLKDFPGRYDSESLWVEEQSTGRDGVSSVIVGSNDLAGAWSEIRLGGRDIHLFPLGASRTQELSLRSGVNLMMYALTGNYKADQVHVPAILERLGR